MACITLSPMNKAAMISRRYIEALFNSGDPNFGIKVLEGASLSVYGLGVNSWSFLQLYAALCLFLLWKRNSAQLAIVNNWKG